MLVIIILLYPATNPHGLVDIVNGGSGVRVGWEEGWGEGVVVAVSLVVVVVIIIIIVVVAYQPSALTTRPSRLTEPASFLLPAERLNHQTKPAHAGRLVLSCLVLSCEPAWPVG